MEPAEEEDAGCERISFSRCDKEFGLYPTGNGEFVEYFKQDSNMKQLFKQRI